MRELSSGKRLIDISSPELDELLDFVSACSRVRDEKALLLYLAEYTPRLVEFESFSILLCDDNRQILRIRRLEDRGFHDVTGAEILLSEMDLILQVLITGVECESATNICLPMQSTGRVVGVLSVASKNARHTDTETRFLHFFADYIGGIFERLAKDVGAARPSETVNPGADAPDGSLAGAHSVSLRMSYLAQHDALTDLPNRLLLDDRLSRALALSKRHARRLAVLFLDLDRFKEVNDSLGHETGDLLLRQVADRLVQCVRSSDTVGRMGGDEFVILLAELEHAEDAAVAAAKVIAAVAAPILVAGQEFRLALSVGISIYPEDGNDPATLIRKADVAMYKAKSQGTGKFVFCTENMNPRPAAG